MLRVRNKRQKDEQAQRSAPTTACATPALASGNEKAARYVTISTKDQQRDQARLPRNFSPSQRGRTTNRRTNSPQCPPRRLPRTGRCKIEVEASKPALPDREIQSPAPRRNGSASPARTRRIPRTRSACASPGSGRWRITFAWHITSQTEIPGPAFPRGKSRKSGSFFECQNLA